MLRNSRFSDSSFSAAEPKSIELSQLVTFWIASAENNLRRLWPILSKTLYTSWSFKLQANDLIESHHGSTSIVKLIKRYQKPYRQVNALCSNTSIHEWRLTYLQVKITERSTDALGISGFWHAWPLKWIRVTDMRVITERLMCTQRIACHRRTLCVSGGSQLACYLPESV